MIFWLAPILCSVGLFAPRVFGITDLQGFLFKSESPLVIQYNDLIDDIVAQDPSKFHWKILLRDTSNDYVFKSHSPASIIRQAGFQSESYKSVSTDGYITELTRLINPLVDAGKRLKSPPVVLYGGPTVSSIAFLMASSNKHHPMPWPRNSSKEWGYTTISNRSLAFMLSNYGYDVWLVPTRGVDSLNLNRTSTKEGFWSFSFDEIIEHEIKNQLDLVRSVTDHDKLTLVPYSTGALAMFAFLTTNSTYAHEHVDSLIALAPIIYPNQLSLYLRLGPSLDAHQASPLIEGHLDKAARWTLAAICDNKVLRYSLCRLLVDLTYGSCLNPFQTHLELRLIDNIMRPISRRCAEQLNQIADSDELRYYSFGLLGNMQRYGKLKPPTYTRLSEGLWPLIDEERITILAGKCDALVSAKSIKQLSENLRVTDLVTIPGYNHLDMLAGWDVDQKVNRLVLDRLEARHSDLDEVYTMEQAWKSEDSAKIAPSSRGKL